MPERSKDFRGRSISKPSDVDRYVGSRVRVRRSILGLSQEKLGEAVGLTFQQVQKYERGINRISASRLFEIGKALDVQVSYFFEGLRDRGDFTPLAGLSLGEESAKYSIDPLERRETYELIQAYYRVNDSQLRGRFLDLLKAFGDPEKIQAVTSFLGVKAKRKA